MWLFGIARNVLSQSARRGRVESAARRRIGLEALVLRPVHVELIAQLIAAEGDAIVERWLAELPADQADALRARVLDEREYADIAQRPALLGGGRAPAGQPRARAAPAADERGHLMTILPELRDSLVRARPESILPELRDGLAGARREAARAAAGRADGTVRRRGLLATAGALAATGVIAIGDPVEPKHVNRDPARGMGVPVDQSARLLPLRAPDPDGGPPWGMRMVTTSRGQLCLQVGRVVDDQLGVLGGDGRLHPLPVAAASAAFAPCIPPDGAGRFYTGIQRGGFASGAVHDPLCHKACAQGEPRQLAYGLLGSEVKKITFADGSVQEPAAPDGAYLFVRKLRESVVAMGGGPTVGLDNAAVRRVDYRDGTHCPKPGEAFCKPKAYVERAAAKPPGSVRRPLRITARRERVSTWIATVVHVRFRAPVAITDSQTMYLLEGRFPGSPIKDCRRVIFYAPTNRNVAAGQRVKLDGTIPPRCKGRLEAHVLLADISYTNGKPRAPVVGRFTRQIP